MLAQRILTAVLLLAVLIPALWVSTAWPFQLLTLLMVGAAAWEWARLNGGAGASALGFGALVAGACILAWSAGWASEAPPAVWWVAAALWIVGGAATLRAGPPAWPRRPAPLRWVIGLVALCSAWLAITQARAVGLNFILSVFCLVWVADIFAYIGGRAFGQRKLAPTVSPGKSWEGVWTGAAAVLLLAVGWVAWDRSQPGIAPSLFSALDQRLGVVVGALALIGLVAMSVVGDLLESLVKRGAGVKDSSGLLPGHGGVLDRIDALLPVFPIALALTSR